MAIGRQILSGLFGATAGGLSGFAQQKAEERARMQRQMEREEERAYQMGLIEQEREYAQRIATERDLLEGRIRRADRPEVDIQPKTLPSQLLRDVVSGTAPGIGMAARATGPSPLSMARGGREALPEAELRADFTPTAMAPPARELIERGGQLYEAITPEEQAARKLEAERGGLDAIEVARLREVARGPEASPERETARAALSDIDVSYQTEQDAKLQELDALDNFLRTEYPSLSNEDRVQLLLQHNLPRPLGPTGGTVSRRGDRVDPAIKQIAENYSRWTLDDVNKLNPFAVYANASAQQLMLDEPLKSTLWSAAGAQAGSEIDQQYALDIGRIADGAARASEVGVLTNFDISRYRSQVTPQAFDSDLIKQKKFENFRVWANWLANNFQEIDNRENLLNQGASLESVMQREGGNKDSYELGDTDSLIDFYLDKAQKENSRRRNETDDEYYNRIADIAENMMDFNPSSLDSLNSSIF
jgi:hypothetical protein